MAYSKLLELRKLIGDDSTFIKDVTLNDLRRSTRLQSLIMDYNFLHFQGAKKLKNSMEREAVT